MLRSGHRGIAGVILYPMTALFMHIYPESSASLVVICGLYALSTIPDIDQTIIDRYGNRIQIGSRSFELSHRGFTHSAHASIISGIVFLLVYLPIGYVFSLDFSFVVAVSIVGFLYIPLHCIGDIFTPSGIDYIPPFTRCLSIGWFYHNNSLANLGSFVVGMVGILLSLLHYLNPSDVNVWLPLSVLLFLLLLSVLYLSKKVSVQLDY